MDILNDSIAGMSPREECRRRKERGFSLLDVVIAIGIVAILSAIAYPLYLEQVTEGRRADGIATLLEAALRQEQHYFDNGAYTNDMREIGYASDPAHSVEGFYEVDVTLSNGGQGFTLTAKRENAQTSDAECGDLTLNHLAVKSAVNSSSADPAGECW